LEFTFASDLIVGLKKGHLVPEQGQGQGRRDYPMSTHEHLENVLENRRFRLEMPESVLGMSLMPFGHDSGKILALCHGTAMI
jgi:hypothetical protein